MCAREGSRREGDDGEQCARPARGRGMASRATGHGVVCDGGMASRARRWCSGPRDAGCQTVVDQHRRGLDCCDRAAARSSAGPLGEAAGPLGEASGRACVALAARDCARGRRCVPRRALVRLTRPVNADTGKPAAIRTLPLRRAPQLEALPSPLGGTDPPPPVPGAGTPLHPPGRVVCPGVDGLGASRYLMSDTRASERKRAAGSRASSRQSGVGSPPPPSLPRAFM
jgi:hypothetical protein